MGAELRAWWRRGFWAREAGCEVMRGKGRMLGWVGGGVEGGVFPPPLPVAGKAHARSCTPPRAREGGRTRAGEESARHEADAARAAPGACPRRRLAQQLATLGARGQHTCTPPPIRPGATTSPPPAAAPPVPRTRAVTGGRPDWQCALASATRSRRHKHRQLLTWMQTTAFQILDS